MTRLTRVLLAIGGLIASGAGVLAYDYWRWFGGGGDVFETIPPPLPDRLNPTAVLIFTKTNGYRDEASIDAATAALRHIADQQGWSAVVTDNGAVFNPAQLARFKVVIANNSSGDNLLPAQEAAMRAYVERGGGFVGIHGAGGDPSYAWRWYVDTLIGAQFKGHPMLPQFQRATVHVEDRTHPATRHLGSSWVRTDEWYSFEKSPRDHVHVLATLDEHSYRPRFFWKDVAMGRDHPIVWSHCVGRGRAFYSAMGHTPASYSELAYATMLSGAIRWAAGLEGPACLG